MRFNLSFYLLSSIQYLLSHFNFFATSNTPLVSYNDVVSSIAEKGMLITSSSMLLFLIVLVFGFLFWFLKQNSKFLYKQIHDEFKIIAESHKKLHGSLLEISQNFSKATSLQNTSISEPRDVVSRDKIVLGLLREFRLMYNSHRVDLFLFTNGMLSYSHHASYMRFVLAFSSLSESCRVPHLREAPVSLFASFFDYLFCNREVHIDASSIDIFVEGIVREWLLTSGSVFSIGLLKEGEIYIGFIAVINDDILASSEYIGRFHDLCEKLSILLASH